MENTERKMLNINGILFKEPEYSEFDYDGKTVKVANFVIVKSYGKGKEYLNCSVYGDKHEIVKTFDVGDLIHTFGYFRIRKKEDKIYQTLVVKSLKKIKEKEELEEEE